MSYNSLKIGNIYLTCIFLLEFISIAPKVKSLSWKALEYSPKNLPIIDELSRKAISQKTQARDNALDNNNSS